MSRILVVDDEAGIRKVVRDALEHRGFEFVTAEAGEYFFHVTGTRSRV